MSTRNRRFALAAVLLLAGSSGRLLAADESEVHLKPADDAALTQARCSSCHSLDYIPMNSVFLKRAGWEAEVRKMIRVMGAPISDADAARIVDYLTRYYGTG